MIYLYIYQNLVKQTLIIVNYEKRNLENGLLLQNDNQR